ncbi:MAG: RagB/SusD family nutrient uptake outer membrane protein [Aquirufa sp.]
MKRYILLSVFAGLSLASVTSCTDLEVKEIDSIKRVSTGSGYTPGNATQLLESAYKSLSTFNGQDNIYALGEHTTAEMIPPTRGVDWGDNGVWRTLDQHTWDATHSWNQNAWNGLHSNVFKCNEILAASPSTLQAAEAKFIRALFMYYAMDFWGQVPFRQVTEGVNDNPKVLTRSEAFDFIVKDLTEALPALPSFGPAGTTGKASKAAANFLLAKLYLNKAVYKGAPALSYTFDNADMAKVVSYVDAITADGFTFDSDYFNIFSKNSQSEIIMKVDEGDASTRYYMTLHYGQDPSGWNGFATLGDFYNTFDASDARRGKAPKLDGTKYAGIGWGFLKGPQFNANGTPLIDERSKKQLDFSADVKLAGALTHEGIRVIKWHPTDAGKMILFRYSEAALMKAEALVRSGKAADALTLVNAMRASHGATALGSITVDGIFKEWGNEMYWEGMKRTVEVRHGKFTSGTGVLDSKKSDVNTLLYPIPASAVVSNPNLKQNPGY